MRKIAEATSSNNIDAMKLGMEQGTKIVENGYSKTIKGKRP